MRMRPNNDTNSRQSQIKLIKGRYPLGWAANQLDARAPFGSERVLVFAPFPQKI